LKAFVVRQLQEDNCRGRVNTLPGVDPSRGDRR
jgi:hypothetical protein